MSQLILKKILILHFLIAFSLLLLVVGCGGGSGRGGRAGDNGSGPSIASSVILKWNAPTTNLDGSVLTDLAGYMIYYGKSSYNYSYKVDVGNSTEALINNLSEGNWCFAVTAYDLSGNESNSSNEVCSYVS